MRLAESKSQSGGKLWRENPRTAKTAKTINAKDAKRTSGRRLWQLEIHRDLSLNLDRLAVQVVGLVLPLLYSIECGGTEHCVAAQNLHIRNIAIFADGGQQLHGALHVRLHRLRRIDGRNFLH